MVDITKIQLNPIPPTMIELQSANILLNDKNKALLHIFITVGFLLGIYIIDKVAIYIKEENEQKNKN